MRARVVRVPPALVFQPDGGSSTDAVPAVRAARPGRWVAGERPESDEELAFLPVTELSALLRARKVSSVELTRLYLDRLERHDPTLQCVISRTDELALE